MENRRPPDCQKMASFLWWTLLLVAMICGTSTADIALADPPVGQVAGVVEDDVKIFRGIPYAKPPERWMNPKYPDPFTSSPYNATTDKPMCLQTPCPDPLLCTATTSEDCLYLNVFSPLAANATNPKPVLFFIHGGAFTYFTGLSPLFSGLTLAKNGDLVVVSINYRLGFLGFMATGCSDDDVTGNFGIKDQRMALKWVHRNILAFGGDPDKVTIFGQSAGAESVGLHLVNRRASKYFNGAIMHSAPFSITFLTKEDALVQAELFALTLACPIGNLTAMIACARSKSELDILVAQTTYMALRLGGGGSQIKSYIPLGPVIDGKEVPMNLMDAFRLKLADKGKPVILGTTSEEAVLYIYRIGFGVPYTKFLSILNDMVRTKSPRLSISQIMAAYPPTNIVDAREEYAQMGTDYIFTCAARQAARYLKRCSGRVWLYHFDQYLSFNDGWGTSTHCHNRSCHGVDLAYIFNVVDQVGFSFTTEEQELSAQMVRYWSNFAYTGNPNSPEVPDRRWKGVGRRAVRQIIFKTPDNDMVPGNAVQGSQCTMWDSIGYS